MFNLFMCLVSDWLHFIADTCVENSFESIFSQDKNLSVGTEEQNKSSGTEVTGINYDTGW